MKYNPLLLVIIFIFSCKEKQPELKAPLFGNLGNYEMKISSKNAYTQKFFNQGIALTYGFNHAEAERSFMEAARLDSNCAICYWGAALVNGPNINAPMSPEVYAKSYSLVQKAIAKKEFASDKEKALIDALAKRYPTREPVADRSQYDKDFAEAMVAVQSRFPEDDDIAAMTAESLMDVHPWNYWLRDGTAQPWTQQFLDLLEMVMERNPNHPGANHYYIHAVEASSKPENGLPAAERLATLIPGAGHLVHMPSHIYIRTGQYHEAVDANEKAIKADSAYFAQCHAQGFYPASYATHNVHFLFITAAFEGRSKDAITAARNISHKMMDSSHLFHDPIWGPTMQDFLIMELIAYVRFAKWDEILDYPKPDSTLGFPTALWHYARGYAFVGKGDVAKAEGEWKAIVPIASDTTYKSLIIFGINNEYDIMNVAEDLLKAEIEAGKGNMNEANKFFASATAKEDQLNYNEPPDWYFPVRNAWGAALLEHGDYAGAEKIFREHLLTYKNDPWVLYGLYQSLEKQGKTEEAAKVKSTFDDKWKNADFELMSARIL